MNTSPVYFVIEGYDEKDLSSRVNGAIADGYKPYGSMTFGTVINGPNKYTHFYQPMIRADSATK